MTTKVCLICSATLLLCNIIPIKASADANQNPARNWMITSQGQPITQPSRNITYQISATCKNKFRKAWQNGIKTWNQLGVIQFTPTNNNPDVVMAGTYNHDKAITNWLHDKNKSVATTNSSVMQDQLTHKAIFSNVNCHFYTVASAGYTQQELNDVAEHELGHALGFDHDDTKQNGKYVVMNSNHDLNIKPIGQYEKDTLLQHY